MRESAAATGAAPSMLLVSFKIPGTQNRRPCRPSCPCRPWAGAPSGCWAARLQQRWSHCAPCEQTRSQQPSHQCLIRTSDLAWSDKMRISHAHQMQSKALTPVPYEKAQASVICKRAACPDSGSDKLISCWTCIFVRVCMHVCMNVHMYVCIRYKGWHAVTKWPNMVEGLKFDRLTKWALQRRNPRGIQILRNVTTAPLGQARQEHSLAQQLGQLLVVAHSQLDVAGHNAGLLVVAGSVAGQLQHLGSQVLKHGGQVHRGASTHSGGIFALLQVPLQAGQYKRWSLIPAPIAYSMCKSQFVTCCRTKFGYCGRKEDTGPYCDKLDEAWSRARNLSIMRKRQQVSAGHTITEWMTRVQKYVADDAVRQQRG